MQAKLTRAGRIDIVLRYIIPFKRNKISYFFGLHSCFGSIVGVKEAGFKKVAVPGNFRAVIIKEKYNEGKQEDC